MSPARLDSLKDAIYRVMRNNGYTFEQSIGAAWAVAALEVNQSK